MLKTDLHQFRQCIQPRHAVVDLEYRLTAGSEYSAAFLDQPLRVRGVLDDAVSVHEVESVVGKRQVFSVGDAKFSLESQLLEVGSGQCNSRGGEIDTGNRSTSSGKPREVYARAAADLKDGSIVVGVEPDELRQVMELFKVVLLEVIKEAPRSYRMAGDFQVMDVVFPIRPDIFSGRHAE